VEAKKGKAGDEDLGHVLLLLLKFAGWLLLIAADCQIVLARPPLSTIADKIYQTVPCQDWNMDLIRHIGPVLVVAIACTPIGPLAFLLCTPGF